MKLALNFPSFPINYQQLPLTFSSFCYVLNQGEGEGRSTNFYGLLRGGGWGQKVA